MISPTFLYRKFSRRNYLRIARRSLHFADANSHQDSQGKIAKRVWGRRAIPPSLGAKAVSARGTALRLTQAHSSPSVVSMLFHHCAQRLLTFRFKIHEAKITTLIFFLYFSLSLFDI